MPLGFPPPSGRGPVVTRTPPVRPPTITVRGTGWRGLLLLVGLAFALFVLPRLVSPPPSTASVEASVRDLRARQARDIWLGQYRAAGADSAALVAAAMARGTTDSERLRLGSIRVRRSWVGPPFARRWAFFVEAREAESGRVSYYRLNRSFATEVSRFRWRLPLF